MMKIAYKYTQGFLKHQDKFIKHGLLSCNQLMILEHKLLDQSCKLFFNKFNPGESILKLGNIIDNNIITEQQEISGYDVASNLRTLMEIFQKSEKGLLQGDLHPEVIAQCQKSFQKYFDELKNDQNQDKFQLLESVFKEVVQEAFNQPLKIPKLGCRKTEHQMSLYQRQIEIENSSHEKAVQSFEKIFEQLQKYQQSINLRFAQKYINSWFPIITKEIQLEQLNCLQNNANKKQYINYINELSAEKIAILSLSCFMRQIMKQIQKEDDIQYIYYQRLLNQISQAINEQFIYEKEKKRLKKEQDLLEEEQNQLSQEEQKLNQTFLFNSNLHVKAKYFVEGLFRNRQNLKKYQDIMIPEDAVNELSEFILQLIINLLKFKDQGLYTQLVTVSYKTMKASHFKQAKVLEINDKLIESLLQQSDRSTSSTIHLDNALPMIYKPANWFDYEIGGYYSKPTNFVRVDGMSVDYFEYANLDNMFQKVDLLSQTSWKVNKDLLDVVEQI